MKLSRFVVLAFLSIVSMAARDSSVPSSSAKRSSKTYYSYSYKPGGGSSVHASGFTHGGGFHLNRSTVSSGSSSLSNWKSKANSAASKLSRTVKLPTLK